MAESSATFVPTDVQKRTARRILFRPRTREAITAYLFLTPFLFFFIIFTVRATGQSLFISFHDWNVMALVHPDVGLKNYETLMNDDIWWTSLKNTFYFSVLTVAGTTVVALGAALICNAPIKGKYFFRALFYAPTLLSIGVIGIIWTWLLNTQFGMLNYVLELFGLPAINWLGDSNLVIPALSLTTIWWVFGFPMLIFLAGLQGIPDHLYEAAKIDGATSRQQFLYITLPLLRPTILFVLVTQFISHFQVFGQPYVMTRGGPGYASYTVIIYLYRVAWQNFHMGYASAMAMALAVVVIIMTVAQFVLLGRRVEY